MRKEIRTIRFLRSTTLFVIILLSFVTTNVSAMDINFFQSNNILYYDPDASGTCVVRPNTPTGGGAATMTGNGATGNKDYKDRQVIPDEQITKIQENQPIYEKASAETKIPWQVFAVVHIRESNLADSNPENDGGSQGIYQDYGWNFNGGKPYPEGPVSDEEFLRQTINAGKELQEKAGDKMDLVEKGDPDAIKDMFFGYNGRSTKYTQQAIALGFTEGYEGSPYVMNIADEKRDPEVQGDNGTWGQIKTDNGPIRYPANSDYGAYIMYAALAGLPTTGGQCVNGGIDSRAGANGWGTSGPNAMTLYYQTKEPWASAPYGTYKIESWGCGPTSTAMAIANLTGDSSVNPEIMAKLFYDSGYLVESGTSWAAWEAGSVLPEKYGVSITNIGTDMAKAAEALRRGSFVILSVRGEPFTCKTCGHILLLRGVTDSGKFLVANPANEQQTMDENGFDIQSASSFGIRSMWEIRKG